MGLLTESPTTALIRTGRVLRGLAVASLVANIAIVVTGGVVRLTGSGLGCPTWPRCTPESFVSHPALGIHGAIEFGNRLLTFVLVAIAIATFVAAFRYRDEGRKRRDFRWVAGAMALGIPVQAVIGGISVLLQLNPYVVGLHFVVSMVLIALSVWLVRLTWRARTRTERPLAVVAVRVALVGMALAVIVGTVLTGSGPHAGDADVPRNNLSPVDLAHLHAALVYVTIAATLLAVALLRSRAAVLVLGVEVVQAVIGITQYNIGLPIGLVALHLLGAGLAVAAVTNLHLSVRSAGSS